ncbi:hypothetical protein FHW13_001636 [Dokdonella fugitiva]|jgi:hypothetical protein|nr:hypothetical protein [Dokdonella fugitiva]
MSGWKRLSVLLIGCVAVPSAFLLLSIIPLSQHLAFTRAGDFLAGGLLLALTTSLLWVPIAGGLSFICLWRARLHGEETRSFTRATCIALVTWAALLFTFIYSCSRTSQCLRM